MRQFRLGLLVLAVFTLSALLSQQYVAVATAQAQTAAAVASASGAMTTPPPGAVHSAAPAEAPASLRIPYPGGAASQLPGDPDSVLHLTFATESVSELLHNWALHTKELGLPTVVAAIDPQTAAFCERVLRTHYIYAFDDQLMQALASARGSQHAANMRGNAAIFLALGAKKVAAIVYLLGLSPRTIVVSDVDVAWLSDPSAMVMGRLRGLEDFAHADLIASSDCVSPEDDVNDDGCFHTLIDRNTGVLAVRPTRATIDFLIQWGARTANASLTRETDQTAFDDLLRGRISGHRRQVTPADRAAWFEYKKQYCGFPPGISEGNTMGSRSPRPRGRNHTPGSRWLFDVCIPRVSRNFTFGTMPIAMVANGHSFFAQQLQLQSGRWPMAVHATYQFGDSVDCAFGKRERLREWGLWRVPDDPFLFPPTAVATAGNPASSASDLAAAEEEVALGFVGGSERFLVLHDDEPLPPAAPWAGQADPHIRGRQHVAWVDGLFQRLAAGISLARALKRTIVLPPLYCYCERHWARLAQCTIGRTSLSSQPLPFRCPMDHILPLDSWHGQYPQRAKRPRCSLPPRADGDASQGFPFRTSAWLNRLAASRHVVASTATLRALHPDPPPPPPPPPPPLIRPLPADTPRQGPAIRTKHGAHLRAGREIWIPAGSTDGAVRSAYAAQRTTANPIVDGKGEPTLLHVTLQDAAAMLRCSADAPHLQQLFGFIFRSKWCFRPEEMTDVRPDPFSLHNETIDVCVWGFKVPDAPPECGGVHGGQRS